MAISRNARTSVPRAAASAGIRLIGTLDSPVFIIDSMLGWGKPASRAISRCVLSQVSIASRRYWVVGEWGCGRIYASSGLGLHMQRVCPLIIEGGRACLAARPDAGDLVQVDPVGALSDPGESGHSVPQSSPISHRRRSRTWCTPETKCCRNSNTGIALGGVA